MTQDPSNENINPEAVAEAYEAMSDAAETVLDLGTDEDGEFDPERISQLIEQLQAENVAMKDKMMRTMAEMENLRRRTQKDVSDAKSYAVAAFARDMLAVGDNMRRAIDALPSEESPDPALNTLVEGIQMTERDMLNTFEKHGIRRVNPEGERFDPNFHQAMFEVDNPELTTGTVMQVVAPGYVIGDRVLRPAMVGVSKGGPKPVKPAEAPSGDAPEAGSTIDIES